MDSKKHDKKDQPKEAGKAPVIEDAEVEVNDVAPDSSDEPEEGADLEALKELLQQKELEVEKEKKDKEVGVYFRIPAACTVRLLDGMDLILQSRMPIYQLGQETSLPLNMVLK